MNKQDNTEVFKRGFKPKIGEFVVVTDDIPNVDKGSILKVRRVVHGVDSIVLTDDNLYAYARSEHIRPLRPDEVANGEQAKQFVGREGVSTDKVSYRPGSRFVLRAWNEYFKGWNAEVEEVEDVSHRYLKDPESCPFCGSRDLNNGGGRIDDYDAHANRCWMQIQCNDCGRRWDEIFDLCKVDPTPYEEGSDEREAE